MLLAKDLNAEIPRFHSAYRVQLCFTIQWGRALFPPLWFGRHVRKHLGPSCFPPLPTLPAPAHDGVESSGHG